MQLQSDISNAMCEKPHVIAKDLIEPWARKIVEIMIGLGAKNKIEPVSPFDDSIRRQTDGIAAEVCEQVCSEIQQSDLQATIQLNKSASLLLKVTWLPSPDSRKKKK